MKQETTIGEVVLVTAIFSGFFVFASLYSVLTGFPVLPFSDASVWETAGVQLFACALAFCILIIRGWKAADFAFEVTISLTVVGLVLFFVGWLVHLAYATAAGSLIPGSEMLDRMAKATSMTLPSIVMFSIVNGVYEEYFLSHYLIQALANHGVSMALGASALVRISYHFYQGPFGAVAVLTWGLVMTLFYWRFRKVWPIMVAHVCTDIGALLQLSAG